MNKLDESVSGKPIYNIQIREQHLDTFGHVNNAAYLQIYEESRWDYLTKHNYGLKEIHELKKGPMILDIKMKMRKEICNLENIQITFEVTSFLGKLMTVAQKMIKEDGTVASEAEFRIGFMDLETRSLINPTDKWLKTLEDLLPTNKDQ